MTSIRPLQDRVIIKRIEEGEQIRGGIIIPDTAREKPMQGIVLAVGEGKKRDNGERIPMDVKEGDHVLFGKWAGGDPIKIDGEDILIMREEEILGVIERAGEGSKAKGKASK